MTGSTLRRAMLTRRELVASLAGGVAAAAWPGGGPGRGDVEDLAAAERLLGLSFTEEERRQTARRVAMHRRRLEELRAAPISRWTPPALRFDPRPAGRPGPEGDTPAAWDPPADLPAVETSEDLAFATVDELAGLLRAGSVTSVQLTRGCLERLKRFDPILRCVVTLLEDRALEDAARADAELRAGKPRGPLHGIPFGAKDLFAWPGAPTTFGAEPFREQVLDFEATVLSRLRAQGAVLVAKLSLGALAMGDVWFGGRTRNPWNPEQGSSGSSAGSAAAVAAGLLPFALGTETNGSIVSPCTRCGASGLRPTFGVVSRHGAMPLSWTMDKVGVIARHATDLALVFEAIRGPDGGDPDVVACPFPWRRARPVEGMRAGYVRGRGEPSRSERAFLAVLEEAGLTIEETRLPEHPYRAMLAILFVEAAAAFDPLLRSGRIRELVAQGPRNWPNVFRAARFFPGVEYLQANRLRTRLIEDMARLMERHDILISPPHGTAMLSCTNLSGHPAVVLPAGARADGTPTAMTVVGRLYDEARLLAVAEAYQARTAWHRRRPRPDK